RRLGVPAAPPVAHRLAAAPLAEAGEPVVIAGVPPVAGAVEPVPAAAGIPGIGVRVARDLVLDLALGHRSAEVIAGVDLRLDLLAQLDGFLRRFDLHLELGLL